MIIFDGWNMFEVEAELPPGTRMNLDAANVLTVYLADGTRHDLVAGDIIRSDGNGVSVEKTSV